MAGDDRTLDTRLTFSLDTGEIPAGAPPSAWTLAGRYVMGERIGAGGFGEVWGARDALEGGEVAVKLLSALSAKQQARVRHEITALRWLRLPGVVRLLDDGQEDGRTFIVMERIRGRAFPATVTPADWPALEPLVVQLLETLAQVHRAGVVHLDLKPGNVLVEDGRCVVLDFGLAQGRSLAPTFGEHFIGGTPRYAAPEQLLGNPEPASDLFSLGVMIYEAITGRVPDDRGALIEQVERRRSQPLPPLRESWLPPRVQALLNQLIAHDPRDRPPDAVAALGLLGHTSSQALEPALEERLPPAGRLAEPALRGLFKGPDIFLHLKEDGARELWARTGGEVGRIRAELAAWVRNGVARLEGGLVALDRVALDRLAAGLRLVGAMPPPEGAELSEDALSLLGWIRVAWPETEEALLRSVADPYVADFDAALAALIHCGLTWHLSDGRLGAGAPIQARAGWSVGLHLAAHEEIALAMPERSEGRLRHLLAARAEPGVILAALPRVVRGLYLEGREARAIALLDLGVRLARERSERGLEAQLMLERVDLALGEQSSKAVDRALYELGRCVEPVPEIQAAERLVKGALLTRRGDVKRALAILEDSGCAPSEGLDVWRQAFRSLASAELGLEAEKALIEELYQWAGADGYRLGRVQGWEANLRYRQGRYRQAAALRSRSAEAAITVRQRLGAMYHGAASLMEAGELEEAARLSDETAARAAECRIWDREAYATWVARVARYRLERPLAPEPALVEGARAIGGTLEGLLALIETAIAARAGHTALAASLAASAALVFREHQRALHKLVADALLLSLGRDPGVALAPMIRAAEACPIPEIGAQILGLLAMGTGDKALFKSAAELLRAATTTRPRVGRLDVLSCDEATGQSPPPW